MIKILGLFAFILLIAPASAYVIPQEYRDPLSSSMNEIQIYDVSMAHQDQRWAQDNLLGLSKAYGTGYLNQRGFEVMAMKIAWLRSHEKK